MTSKSLRRVAYIHSDELISVADALPANIGRASLVHNLIESFDLLDAPRRDDADASAHDDHLPRARVVDPVRATRRMLARFHDSKYLDAILGKESDQDGGVNSDQDSSDDDGTPPPAISSFRLTAPSCCSSESPRKRRKLDAAQLVDDCPMFPELAEYAQLVAGASIQAAKELRDGRADVAIAWTGGRHHGKRGAAAGFCYINDIVLAIQELRLPPQKPPIVRDSSPDPDKSPPLPSRDPVPIPTKISKVMYLDLDLHHGDGVESAFHSSPYVLTLSVHLHAPLFYPSTGSLSSNGPVAGPAAYHALNLALEPGLSSSNLLRLFSTTIEPFCLSFNPDAIVVQCGVDGLQGDPCAEWNLSSTAMGEIVKSVLGWGKKVLLLGGGGYENTNAAKCWTYLTSIALGRRLPLSTTSIPSSLESEEYELYKPDFMLDVPEGNRKDFNTPDKLKEVELVFRRYHEKFDDRYRKLKRMKEKNAIDG